MDSDFVETVRRFYEAHRQELYSYALAITHNRSAAEDAIHAAFSGLLRRRRLPSELRPFVFRSVRNAAIDELRANGREWACEGIFAPAPAADPASDLERVDRIQSLMNLLSEDERECIVLRALNGLTFKEVAAVRGVSINTAASWYRRGLEKMREAWREDGQ